MTETEKTLKKFIDQSFLFIDKNDLSHTFSFVKMSKWKLDLRFWFLEKFRNYFIFKGKPDSLSAVMTAKNDRIIRSLRKRLQDVDYQVLKEQKFVNYKLTRYTMYVLVEENGKYIGVKCKIL